MVADGRRRGRDLGGPRANWLRLHGFVFHPIGPYGMGDVVVAASHSSVSPNRKVVVGYIDDDTDLAPVTPGLLMHSRHGDQIIAGYLASGAGYLLKLARVVREALRRRGQHRDFIDDSLLFEMVTGQRSPRLIGEMETTAARRRAAELQDAAKQPLDIDRDADDLAWWAMCGSRHTQFDATDPTTMAFAGELLDDLLAVEHACNADGKGSGASLLARLEELRNSDFDGFDTVSAPEQGRDLFRALIRSSVHMSSKIAGLATLKLVNERIGRPLTDTETKMLSLLYGPCRELGGISIDMLGRRSGIIRPYLYELYEAYSQNHGPGIISARRKLFFYFYMSSLFVRQRKEADSERKKRTRASKKGRLELPATPLPDHEDAVNEAVVAAEAPAKEPDLLGELRELLEDKGFRCFFLKHMQVRVLGRLDALVAADLDVDKAAMALDILPRKLHDTIRKTIAPKLPSLILEYRKEGE